MDLEGCGDCVIVFESVGLDSVNALLDCESALDSALASESIWLDSVSCASFRISALDSVNVLDSESTLDSVDSLFLRVVFSRIFPRFSKSLCFFAKRGVIPSPLAKAPKKPPLFLLRLACKPLARQTGREPRCIRF